MEDDEKGGQGVCEDQEEEKVDETGGMGGAMGETPASVQETPESRRNDDEEL